MGIPIGPDTSFALAELVMSRVDVDLAAGLAPALRGAVRGTRFYDDFEFFTPDRSSASRVAAQLQRTLSEWELTLNPYKLSIEALPTQLDDQWIGALKHVSVPSDNSSAQRAAMITLFSEAFRLRKDYPGDNVLAYAIGQFVAATFAERTVVFKENWREFEGLILQCAEAEPATLPRVTHLLAWYVERGYPVDRQTVRRTLQTIATTEGVSAHGSEVAWALWAAILLEITLSVPVGRAVSRMDDDIVALVALHAQSLGHLPGLDTGRWLPHMSRTGLYEEHWLLAYEALHHGWLPSTTSRDYTRGDSLFGALRRNNVCFYDATARLTAPAITKSGALPGHVGIFNLSDLTTAHREAIANVMREMELDGAPTKPRPRPKPAIVVTDDDDYE